MLCIPGSPLGSARGRRRRRRLWNVAAPADQPSAEAPVPVEVHQAFVAATPTLRRQAPGFVHWWDVSAAGVITLRPHLALTGPTADAVKSLNGAAIAFVPDPTGDGSYDLCLGPYWRTPGTNLRLIPDFLPPRP